MKKHNVTIIGIAGGTGSGKTTVVRKIVEALPENTVAVIPQGSCHRAAHLLIHYLHPPKRDGAR